GSRDAGDRPRDGLRRSIGRTTARGRSGTREGGDAVKSEGARLQAAVGGDLTVAGIALVADCAGALYWPEEGRPAVADLHLEKGSSFATRGVLLPPYDTAATLARLGALVARYAPKFVIALGDSFHDNGGPERVSEDDRAMIGALQRGRD